MDKVCVLLATYNGERFLQEQLDSLFAQSHKSLCIIARDDGSRDSSCEILQKNGVKNIANGENLGVKKNFSACLDYALNEASCDYFMFCDQDDVWKKDKVEKTLALMKQMQAKYPNEPILVHTDLCVVDENLCEICPSFWRYQSLDPLLHSLRRFLLQCTTTGCTMMINRPLANLARNIPQQSLMHDMWVGLVAARFGKIGILNEPTILYRQHSFNDMGAKKVSFLQGIKRGLQSLRNPERFTRFMHSYISQAGAFYERFHTSLDENEKKYLLDLANLKAQSPIKRRLTLLRHKLFRQGFMRNIEVFLFLGRI